MGTTEKMVFAATTNMSGWDGAFDGPLGHIIGGALTAGMKLTNGLAYLQCQAHPGNYYNSDCPAARVYYGKYAGHYDYGKTPAQQSPPLKEVTIKGVKQLTTM